MKTPLELRKHKRYLHVGIAMLEDRKTGYTTYAHTINSSGNGMSFESDYSFNLGMELSITLDKPIFKSSPISFSGIVKWCKKVNDNNSPHYHIGVKII